MRPRFTAILIIPFLLAGCGGGGDGDPAAGAESIGLGRIVVMGDSISAGVRSGFIEAETQREAYPSLVAAQAGVDLPLPLLEAGRIDRDAPFRVNPEAQARNLAVPGADVRKALGPRGPTAILLWIGNNDVLGAAAEAEPGRVTPLDEFTRDMTAIMGRLAATGAPVVVGTIPDVTGIAFLTPVETFARRVGRSIEAIGPDLGIAAGDRLTPQGVVTATERLVRGGGRRPRGGPARPLRSRRDGGDSRGRPADHQRPGRRDLLLRRRPPDEDRAGDRRQRLPRQHRPPLRGGDPAGGRRGRGRFGSARRPWPVGMRLVTIVALAAAACLAQAEATRADRPTRRPGWRSTSGSVERGRSRRPLVRLCQSGGLAVDWAHRGGSELAECLAPVRVHVVQRPSAQTLERDVMGLRTEQPSNNGDPLAAVVPGTTEPRLNPRLTERVWDEADLNRRRVRHLAARPTDGDGVLLVDDTGFAQQGHHPVGVARQDSRTLGQVGHGQVPVNGHYAERTGAWPVATRLYLPEAWAANAARLARAHGPPVVRFHTKPSLALALLDEARACGGPHAGVVADADYGDTPPCLNGLAARGGAGRGGRPRRLHRGDEPDHEEAKGELGWAQFQGRRWDAFHRHAVSVRLAYRFRVWLEWRERQQTRRRGRPRGVCSPSAGPPAAVAPARPSPRRRLAAARGGAGPASHDSHHSDSPTPTLTKQY